MAVALTVTAFAGSTAHAGASSRSHTRRVALTISGDEYETPDGKPLNGSNGVLCPPSDDVPAVRARCWTWKAKHLGRGTHTYAWEPIVDLDHIVATVTLVGPHGATLVGTLVQRRIEGSTPGHALGHVNTFPGTIEFTSGTGRFAGITGALTGEATSTVVAVDPATGITHKKVAAKWTGRLRFPRKL